jgi:hypothetical protein
MTQETVDTLPDGSTADFVSVPVKETTERWSELTLDDGTKFKLKLNVISADRAVGKFDNNGNPIYRIKTAPTIFADFVPEKLKKQ